MQALVTYDTMRLNDLSLPWTVRNGRYMPVGLHTPRLTVVAVKVNLPPVLPAAYSSSHAVYNMKSIPLN